MLGQSHLPATGAVSVLFLPRSTPSPGWGRGLHWHSPGFNQGTISWLYIFKSDSLDLCFPMNLRTFDKIFFCDA